MIKLYHCASARSFRPLWALEEMGLPYELIVLAFPPRVFAKDYLTINPLGTIPFFIDGEAKLTESCAICHYLTVAHGPTPLGVAPHESDYAQWLNWNYFADATLTFPQTLVLRYSMFEPKERRQPQVVDDYAKWFFGRLRHVESALEDREYLVAGRFTTADICVGYALMLADMLKLSRDFGPNVAAYWKRLSGRENFIRAIEAQEKARSAQKISGDAAIG